VVTHNLVTQAIWMFLYSNKKEIPHRSKLIVTSTATEQKLKFLYQ